MTDYPQSPTRPRLLLREMPASERPLYRLVQHGQDALSNMELLALVLGTYDGPGLAYELLQQFGSLQGLAAANRAQLMRHRGIGAAQASRLLALFTLARRLQSEQAGEKTRVFSPNDAAQHFFPRLSHLQQEELHILLLNAQNALLGIETVYRGSLNVTHVRVGELFRAAIEQNAAAIIMAHNHPSGAATVSREDMDTTRAVAEAGKLLGVELLDSLVIAGNGFTSLKERGLFD